MGKWQAGSSRRMKHESKDSYIPYNLSTDGDSGAGTGYVDSWLNLLGDVYSKDFAGAALGNYSDTVIITITPSVAY